MNKTSKKENDLFTMKLHTYSLSKTNFTYIFYVVFSYYCITCNLHFYLQEKKAVLYSATHFTVLLRLWAIQSQYFLFYVYCTSYGDCFCIYIAWRKCFENYVNFKILSKTKLKTKTPIVHNSWLIKKKLDKPFYPGNFQRK